VLHTHFTRFDLPAVAVARGYPNVRVFWHLHTRLLRGPVAAVRNALKLGIAGRQVEAMLCVSEDIYVAARHRFAPADRLMVFSNAIDLERFRPAATAEERRLARVTLSQSPDRPLLVHFGWDWERKGGDLFLAAVEILLRSGLDVQALCVGGGDSARATSARLGLGDRASVLEPRDDVRTFYAAADVFVSPSQAEGMPYAVLEALCTGTPAVTSDIPSHALLAERTQLCTLAERNPQALALAMRSVLSASSEGRSSSDISELVDSIDLRAWAQRLVALYAEER
jgi:glycosyltransferase involved in cell wall biosynthesis